MEFSAANEIARSEAPAPAAVAAAESDAAPPLIRAVNLRKLFPTPEGREIEAVRDVSFEVRAGQIYGLLGPNGAGKTTTLRIVSGLLRAASGRVEISGYDATDEPEFVRRKIGFLTSNTGLYARLTPIEVLRYFGVLYDLSREAIDERVEALVELLEMHKFKETRCGALSTGQKQRTNIARALIADPPILIMDEPTLGLDVISNRLILRFIAQQAALGKAILLSTHALDEIERLCGRIGLMHSGTLIAEGSLAELCERTGKDRLSEVFLSLVHPDEPTFAH